MKTGPINMVEDTGDIVLPGLNAANRTTRYSPSSIVFLAPGYYPGTTAQFRACVSTAQINPDPDTNDSIFSFGWNASHDVVPIDSAQAVLGISIEHGFTPGNVPNEIWSEMHLANFLRANHGGDELPYRAISFYGDWISGRTGISVLASEISDLYLPVVDGVACPSQAKIVYECNKDTGGIPYFRQGLQAETDGTSIGGVLVAPLGSGWNKKVGGPGVQIRSHGPTLLLERPASATDEKTWSRIVTERSLVESVHSDDGVTSAAWLTVERTGAAIKSIRFAGQKPLIVSMNSVVDSSLINVGEFAFSFDPNMGKVVFRGRKSDGAVVTEYLSSA